jgi:putative flippase GtrA
VKPAFLSATFVRFVATGMLNAAFGYGLYAVFVLLGMPYLPALALATALGVCFNFVTFGRLAFRATLSPATFARFLAGYGLSLAFNMALLWLLRARAGLDPYTAQLLCVAPTVAVTYLILNRWVYALERRHANP